MTTALHTAQAQLFDTADLLPEGLAYEAAFISAEEEAELLALLHTLPVRQARYHQYTARRRVYSFGGTEDKPYTAERGHTLLLPAPVRALRERLARWVHLPATDFAQVMVSDYPAGAPLGWHRDAPHYEVIVGVSLGGPATLRFRPWDLGQPREGAAAIGLDLAPRSAYVMRGVARWGWQHSVPPVPMQRFSITMRTLRTNPGPAPHTMPA